MVEVLPVPARSVERTLDVSVTRRVEAVVRVRAHRAEEERDGWRQFQAPSGRPLAGSLDAYATAGVPALQPVLDLYC